MLHGQVRVMVLILTLLTLFVGTFATSGLWAAPEERAEAEARTVLGSRVRGIGYDALSVPVDLYWAEDIAKIGTSDLGIALQRLSPSFHTKRNHLGDGGLFHTAILRGMSADHILVLINGKRRHNISFPRPLTFTTGFGTTGVDLRSIPIAAIERVEVLRDGAATHYGSDAIAGVINIILKDSNKESQVSAMGGITSHGDGQRLSSSLNLGYSLGDGFVNTTLELATQGRTDRAYDTRSVDLNGTHPDHPPRKGVLGEPEYDHISVMVNAGLPINANNNIFAFGGYSLREGLSAGGWRDPVWAEDRMLAPLHPDGFLPFEKSKTADLSITAGWVASYKGWEVETSVQTGRNQFDFGATNSINASWGAEWVNDYMSKNGGRAPSIQEVIAHAGPTSVDSGGTLLTQHSANIDVTGALDFGSRVINVAFGGEYRREDFNLRAGELASWSCGSTAMAMAMDKDIRIRIRLRIRIRIRIIIRIIIRIRRIIRIIRIIIRIIRRIPLAGVRLLEPLA